MAPTSVDPVWQWQRNRSSPVGACGSGTVVEHVELVASADDGLHILGGMVEVRHVVSFTRKTLLKATRVGGVQRNTLWAFKTQPLRMPQSAWPILCVRCGRDDVQDNNMDPQRALLLAGDANFTFITNGAPQPRATACPAGIAQFSGARCRTRR